MSHVQSLRPLAAMAIASIVLTIGLGASSAFAQAGGGSGSLAPLENGLAFIQQFLSGAFGTEAARRRRPGAGACRKALAQAAAMEGADALRLRVLIWPLREPSRSRVKVPMVAMM